MNNTFNDTQWNEENHANSNSISVITANMTTTNNVATVAMRKFSQVLVIDY